MVIGIAIIRIGSSDVNDTEDSVERKDRELILRITGAIFLLVGLASAFIGPLELHCFYLFSEGGPFYFDGFGFGSFMFANIASQVMGYYLIGVIGISLGYAHLKLRRWARPASLTLLWFWLVAGLPLMVVLYGIFIQSKDPSLSTLLITLPFAAILYPVAPVWLFRFYQSDDVTHTFESRDPRQSWLETIPLPVRGLCVLFGLYVFALHVAILFRGIFPVFGTLLAGLWGIFAIDVTILCLVLLTWGFARLKLWAWWGSLAAFGLMALSSIITFARNSVGDILLLMRLPPLEMEAFQNVPFLDYHPALFAAIPPVTTMAIILAVRRHFRADQ